MWSRIHIINGGCNVKFLTNLSFFLVCFTFFLFLFTFYHSLIKGDIFINLPLNKKLSAASLPVELGLPKAQNWVQFPGGAFHLNTYKGLKPRYFEVNNLRLILRSFRMAKTKDSIGFEEIRRTLRYHGDSSKKPPSIYGEDIST